MNAAHLQCSPGVAKVSLWLHIQIIAQSLSPPNLEFELVSLIVDKLQL